MENYYKHILVAGTISLCCSITYLNADLLNGPRSPESQELVKVLQDKTMQIPDRLQFQTDQINIMRDALDTSKLKKNVTSASKLMGLIKRDNSIYDLVKNNPIFLEASIQIIKQEPKLNSSLAIAFVAESIKNIPLFTEAVKAANPETRIEMLNVYMGDLLIKNYDVINQKASRNEYNETKELVKIIFDNSSKNEAYKTMLNSIKVTGFIQDPVNFLLTLGLPLNLVLENNQTFLDQTNAILDIVPEAKGSALVQENIKYLRSKGAKTYAELTAAEKGQKL